MIIFLYGADTYRSRRFLQGLKDKFLRDLDPGASSLNFIDGSAATLKEIGEKINTGSLFVKKRLVVIDNIFKNKKEKIFSELADYLKKFGRDEDNILIFRDEELNTKNKPLKAEPKKLFTILAKQPYSQEFQTLNNNQLLFFIKKEAETYGKTINLPAATRLVGLTNGDLWLIASEIRKLSFRAETKDISLAEVKEMVTGSYDENIFGLTDALSAKDKKTAMSLLEEQYAAGLSDEYLLTMLIRQFKILLQIRAALDSNMNPSDIPAELKLHPFVVKKGISQAKNFSGAILKNYLNDLINLDFLNKTGRGDIKTELALLISGL
jgi:DNA polymerase-3 subunit delta